MQIDWVALSGHPAIKLRAIKEAVDPLRNCRLARAVHSIDEIQLCELERLWHGKQWALNDSKFVKPTNWRIETLVL